ncbi:hypothetical protein [Parapedobacter indicus]|uniref:Histidine kinase n=1 Tax=Parapedobacter indicus TaxID=1477437 RepID=A0A1I3UPC4_9SPHI|nr:hypothetical protein [Parapedobacter indicus]PPK99142.1 hypothetical protein CLV26_115175 [Parapedobacter indicus]SFJ84775.1 hypothetical protein SAMN05444682_1153 [Parapedobacter indicus]
MDALFSVRYRFGWIYHLSVCLAALLCFLFYWYGAVRPAHPSHRADVWISLLISIPIFYINFLWVWPFTAAKGHLRWGRTLLVVTCNLLGMISLSVAISMILGNLEIDWEDFTPKDVFSLVDGSIRNFAPYALPNLLSLLASWVAFIIERIYPPYANRTKIRQEIQQARQAWRRAQLDPHLLDTHLLMLSVITRESKASVQLALDYTIRVVQFYIGGNDPRAPIKLVDEIECIRCMIEIQSIRYGAALNWKLEVDVDVDELAGINTIPMVVIPLAENMIRYAVLNRADAPAVIRVRLAEEDLWITAENRIRIEKGREGSGTGLANLEERLQYAYPDRYRLATRKDDGWFYTEIVIFGIGKKA